MEPIKATCRACGRVFLVSEIPQLGTGSCPTCGELLAPGHTHMLLDEARRVQALRREFAASLRRLCALPGNLVVDRDAVYEALAAELPQPEQLAVDQSVAAAESRRLRRAVREWPRLRHRERTRVTPALVAGLHALAERVRCIAGMHDDVDRPVLREAAQAVDEAAERIRTERLHAEDQTVAALDRVTAATGGPQR